MTLFAFFLTYFTVSHSCLLIPRFGKHFETPLLIQSLVMITAMFIMMDICVRTRNRATVTIYSQSGSRSEGSAGRTTKTFIGKTYTLIPNNLSFDHESPPSSSSSSSAQAAVTAFVDAHPPPAVDACCSHNSKNPVHDSRRDGDDDANTHSSDADDHSLDRDEEEAGVQKEQREHSLVTQTALPALLESSSVTTRPHLAPSLTSQSRMSAGHVRQGQGPLLSLSSPSKSLRRTHPHDSHHQYLLRPQNHDYDYDATADAAAPKVFLG